MKILLFLLSFFLMNLTISQGNLQFNQVINLENGMNYTVPVGKVVRIESINYLNPSTVANYSSCIVNCPGCGASSGVSCSYASINYLQIGSAVLTLSPPGIYVNSGGTCAVCPASQTLSVTPSNFTLPIWLNSGNQINVMAIGIFISAIEFNVVP
jgi:hypothetical protein